MRSPSYKVDRTKARIRARVIISRMPASALFAFNSRASDRLSGRQHAVQVHRHMPAWVVLSVPRHAYFFQPQTQTIDNVHCLIELRGGPNDADQVVHAVLEIGMDRV